MGFLSRWNHSSDLGKAYPRSRTEPWFEKYAKHARDSIRKSLGVDVQLWMTDDSFEQVVTHYRGMGIERSAEFAKSLARWQSDKSGREVKATYIIFDGADSAVLSKPSLALGIAKPNHRRDHRDRASNHHVLVDHRDVSSLSVDAPGFLRQPHMLRFLIVRRREIAP